MDVFFHLFFYMARESIFFIIDFVLLPNPKWNENKCIDSMKIDVSWDGNRCFASSIDHRGGRGKTDKWKVFPFFFFSYFLFVLSTNFFPRIHYPSVRYPRTIKCSSIVIIFNLYDTCLEESRKIVLKILFDYKYNNLYLFIYFFSSLNIIFR